MWATDKGIRILGEFSYQKAERGTEFLYYYI